VFIGVSLIFLLAGLRKNYTQPIFTKLGEKGGAWTAEARKLS